MVDSSYVTKRQALSGSRELAEERPPKKMLQDALVVWEKGDPRVLVQKPI